MSLVQLHPEASNRPYLTTAGLYGAGKNGFEVEIGKFESPAEDRLPGYDQENEEGPYSYFGFHCRDEDGSILFVDDWQKDSPNSGSKTAKWLAQIGVAISDSLEFDPDDVAGRKVIIEVGDPRTGKDGVTRTGYVRNVIGI